MNYYKTETTYFLVFILIAVTSFAAIPFMVDSLNSYSDSYIRSQINKIQAEMLFIDIKKGEYDKLCYTGETGNIISDLINENSKYISCRTNKPNHSKAIICAQLKVGSYYCADSIGVTCYVYNEPIHSYSCKNI